MGAKGVSKYEGQIYEGQEFGEWVVLTSQVFIEREAKALCKCSCGTERKVSIWTLLNKTSTACTVCSHTKVGASNPTWKGIGDVPRRFTKRAPTEDDAKAIVESWDECNQTCALTGWPITFKDKTASLDRIDSQKGYIRGNLQWVHTNANICKNAFENEYFITLCHAVARHHSNPKIFESIFQFGK